MVEADAVVASIRLNPEDEGLSPLYSPGLGFAYIEASSHPPHHRMTLIGFTGDRQKPQPVSGEAIASVTELEYLQEEERSIKMQARGVGTRMYNTAQALLGTGEGDTINAYRFTINPERIADRRRASDGTLRGRAAQAARQIGRMAQVEVMGLQATVDRIHGSFGEGRRVDGVLYNQSAAMELQQRRLGSTEQPAGVPPEFMVIRNPHILMHKIGSYRA